MLLVPEKIEGYHRDACLTKLANVGPFVRGSLCAVKRGNATAHPLTVSINGKTHTVYVPVDKVEEVRSWIHNRKMLEKWIVEMSKLNMAILHAQRTAGSLYAP